MSQYRKGFWRGALAAAAVAGFATTAMAQSELKIMAPAAPGGGWDQTARSMQQALTTAGLAKSVQVTNVPGAGGSIGIAQFVNGAKGDGSQLMVMGYVMVGALLTNKSPVTLDQTTPIARLTGEYEAIVVPADSPIKNAKDLAAAVKADPAKVTWAGGSAGGVDHIAVALFAKAVGADPTKINYIPFSGGGESLAAILGGKVTAGISGYGEFESQIKAGKLRLIGLTTPKGTPDMPSLKEQGVNLEIANWRAVVAAPGISADQKKALSETIDKLAKSKEWAEILKQKGWDDAYLSGDAFAKFLAEDTNRTKEVLTSVGLVK
ncbi:tripartite tricarboxylate transporter substrate-binding protein [Microvirga terricola]|uniref:Tripartite tricarboxylate transporter substrate binding protein n=1 Tax=Microvirga terricola TaxID=2719797 RepID=A0ABX0VBB4_9HYPH|nr:tripartite tricarboxylate transporter substrate binding protein [Microvirga terricola]